jgi:hypothetical protein
VKSDRFEEEKVVGVEEKRGRSTTLEEKTSKKNELKK